MRVVEIRQSLPLAQEQRPPQLALIAADDPLECNRLPVLTIVAFGTKYRRHSTASDFIHDAERADAATRPWQPSRFTAAQQGMRDAAEQGTASCEIFGSDRHRMRLLRGGVPR
jgi:hypothetical protein